MRICGSCFQEIDEAKQLIIGYRCHNCKKDFAFRDIDVKDKLYCPYCGLVQPFKETDNALDK